MTTMRTAVALWGILVVSAPALGDVTATGSGSAAIGVNNGVVNVNGTMVSAEERGRRIVNFLMAKQLPIPGRSYSDSELASGFGVQQRGGFNFSYDILSGSFQGLSSSNNSPIGRFSKIVLQKSGAVLAVLLSQSCDSNARMVCANNFNDWRGALQNIEGNQILEGEMKLGGSAPGSPFPPGTLHKFYAYDGEWRFYIDRMDTPDDGSGPAAITLLLVRER
jgi:hypothetical protein